MCGGGEQRACSVRGNSGLRNKFQCKFNRLLSLPAHSGPPDLCRVIKYFWGSEVVGFPSLPCSVTDLAPEGFLCLSLHPDLGAVGLPGWQEV